MLYLNLVLSLGEQDDFNESTSTDFNKTKQTEDNPNEDISKNSKNEEELIDDSESEIELQVSKNQDQQELPESKILINSLEVIDEEENQQTR